MIVTDNDPKLLDGFISTLSREFAMKDMGPLHYFLGVEVRIFSGGLICANDNMLCQFLNVCK